MKQVKICAITRGEGCDFEWALELFDLETETGHILAFDGTLIAPYSYQEGDKFGSFLFDPERFDPNQCESDLFQAIKFEPQS